MSYSLILGKMETHNRAQEESTPLLFVEVKCNVAISFLVQHPINDLIVQEITHHELYSPVTWFFHLLLYYLQIFFSFDYVSNLVFDSYLANWEEVILTTSTALSKPNRFYFIKAIGTIVAQKYCQFILLPVIFCFQNSCYGERFESMIMSLWLAMILSLWLIIGLLVTIWYYRSF